MYSAEMKNHANIAAAHSTPTTLAVDRLRSLNSVSGISGCATRASMAMNNATPAHAAPSSVSVRAEVQPASLPPTIAYTASISETVIVTAPDTSSGPGDVGTDPLSSSANVSA